MPDWEKLVRDRLALASFPDDTKEDVITELGLHLEEAYEHARASGLTQRDAIRLTLQEIGNWQVLSEKIRDVRSQEVSMNQRTKTLWLPALATLLGASLLLAGIEISGLGLRLVWIHGMGMSLYWPWLAGLPVFGAIGAWLSRRAQGQIEARLAASAFPALVMLVVMGVILPYGVARSGFSFFRIVHFGLGFVNWVMLPAVSLLIGAIPFLRAPKSAVIAD
jgi:hypothetical protein